MHLLLHQPLTASASAEAERALQAARPRRAAVRHGSALLTRGRAALSRPRVAHA